MSAPDAPAAPLQATQASVMRRIHSCASIPSKWLGNRSTCSAIQSYPGAEARICSSLDQSVT